MGFFALELSARPSTFLGRQKSFYVTSIKELILSNLRRGPILRLRAG